MPRALPSVAASGSLMILRPCACAYVLGSSSPSLPSVCRHWCCRMWPPPFSNSSLGPRVRRDCATKLAHCQLKYKAWRHMITVAQSKPSLAGLLADLAICRVALCLMPGTLTPTFRATALPKPCARRQCLCRRCQGSPSWHCRHHLLTCQCLMMTFVSWNMDSEESPRSLKATAARDAAVAAELKWRGYH